MSDERLGIHSVTALLGTVNTEQKIILLGLAGRPESDEYNNKSDIATRLVDSGVTLGRATISPSTIGLVLERTKAKGLIDGDPASGYRRTELGEIALGTGGKLLGIGLRNNVPVKKLVGEEGQRLREGGYVVDAIEKRIGLFMLFGDIAGDKWHSLPDLTPRFEEYGIPYEAGRLGLHALANLSVLEQRQSPRTAVKNPEFRWKNVEGTNTRDAVDQYLHLVGRIAVMDQEYLADGVDEFHRLYADTGERGHLDLLFTRAHTMTPRHSRSTVHTKATSLV